MTRPEILQAAHEAVCGSREQSHGTPEDSFAAIAALWSVYLQACNLLPHGKQIDSVRTADMMVLFKVGRTAIKPNNADSWVDKAGYAACGGELATATIGCVGTMDQEERAKPFPPEHLKATLLDIASRL